jgi:hypothetical protein
MMKISRALLLLSSAAALCCATPASASLVDIGGGKMGGDGIVVKVNIDYIQGRTTISDIRNLTGVDAFDFHLRYYLSNGNLYNSHDIETTPVVLVPNGGFLRVNGVDASFTENQTVGTIDAWWTDAAGHRIHAIPELSTWAMMILGFCALGFAACRRKTLVAG